MRATKILNSDIKAYLDLNQINNSGNYRLPVNITLSNKLVEFDPLEISIRPEFLNVKVEKKAAKFVPLEPTLVGEVARGYQISNIELDPSFVEIRGPESVLSSVEYLQTSSYFSFALLNSNTKLGIFNEISSFKFTNSLNSGDSIISSAKFTLFSHNSK